MILALDKRSAKGGTNGLEFSSSRITHFILRGSNLMKNQFRVGLDKRATGRIGSIEEPYSEG